MKYFSFLVFIVLQLNANILFLGSDDSQFLCDGKKETPLTIKKCSKIEAITDINMCYFINTNLDCKKLFKGDKFNIKDIDTKGLEFSRLLSFNSVKKTTFGVKRFGSEKELLNVIVPHGDILKPKKNILIAFKNKNKKTIFIKHNNNIIFKKTFSKPTVELNSKLFKFNKDYTLIINIKGEQYLSNFAILDKTTQNKVSRDIQKATKNIDNKRSKEYIKSIIFDQYGLLFNRVKILQGVL